MLIGNISMKSLSPLRSNPDSKTSAVRLGHFAVYIYERGDCVRIYHLVEVVSIL